MSRLLGAFGFCRFDIVSAALDQFGQFLRALTIELDPAAMRGDFALQLLRLAPRIRYLDVDLVQGAPFFAQLFFARINLVADSLF